MKHNHVPVKGMVPRNGELKRSSFLTGSNSILIISVECSISFPFLSLIGQVFKRGAMKNKKLGRGNWDGVQTSFQDMDQRPLTIGIYLILELDVQNFRCCYIVNPIIRNFSSSRK